MSGLEDEQEAPAACPRVLVIDDEALIGLSCRRSLGPAGYEVQTYEDPQAGLEAALSDDFDVILVDLMMPGISGLEILQEIKAAGVSAEVAIITGHSTVESAVEAMKEGAADSPRWSRLWRR